MVQIRMKYEEKNYSTVAIHGPVRICTTNKKLCYIFIITKLNTKALKQTLFFVGGRAVFWSISSYVLETLEVQSLGMLHTHLYVSFTWCCYGLWKFLLGQLKFKRKPQIQKNIVPFIGYLTSKKTDQTKFYDKIR